MATGEWGGTFNQRVFRVNVLWVAGLQKCQTGFHLRDVGVNNLDPEDVATEVADWANDSFRTILHVSDQLVGVDAVNLTTKEGFSVNFSNVNGATTGEAAPTFITAPVSIRGNIRRRYANGRMLWPVRDENMINANQLSTNGINWMQAAITDLTSRFIGPSITTSMHMVHLHEALASTASRPAVPATWYDATSVRLNTLLSSLRRRKVGVGS